MYDAKPRGNRTLGSTLLEKQYQENPTDETQRANLEDS